MTYKEAKKILHSRLVTDNYAIKLKMSEAIQPIDKALVTMQEMADRNVTPEDIMNYMAFEDECVKKGFDFKSLLEAREKMTAKKPEPIDYKKYKDVILHWESLKGAYWCPNCGIAVRSGGYCRNCGQKLDWSKEKEHEQN